MTSLSAQSEFRLDGKTVVVTGASDGIGRAAVERFARAGATVVMVGRNEAKTVAAARSIMSATGSRAIHWEIADLSRQEAVRELAERLRAQWPRLDVLANNAGAMFLERECTPEGLERTFALNHLSYFTLSLLLLPSLVAASRPGAPSRIVCVSSRAHENARPDLHDLQMAKDYGGWRAYANSKLYNLWFTRALARRLDAAQVVVHAMHPGVVSTRFATNNGRVGRVMRRVMDVVSLTPDQGADTLLWLSASPEGVHSSGGYWLKRRAITPSRTARDDERGEQLWAASVQLAHLDADALIHAARAAHALA
jgi:NAD(P)-dependent dehydrogenase (short-subunit alcohol dehydrogenase family)